MIYCLVLITFYIDVRLELAKERERLSDDKSPTRSNFGEVQSISVKSGTTRLGDLFGKD